MRKASCLAIAAVVAGTGSIASPSAIAGALSPARAAHTRSGNAEAELHWVKSSGSNLIEEGPVSGGISGHMHAVLHVSTTFSGSFTFVTREGVIRGRGSATPHGAGRYQSFSGTETITGGTGRFSHARGHGHMYGTFDRKTYDVTIQTRGTITY